MLLYPSFVRTSFPFLHLRHNPTRAGSDSVNTLVRGMCWLAWKAELAWPHQAQCGQVFTACSQTVSTVSPSPGLRRTAWAVPTVVMVLFSADNLHVSSWQLLGLCHFLHPALLAWLWCPGMAALQLRQGSMGPAVSCCQAQLECVLSEQCWVFLCWVSVPGSGDP